LLFNYEDMHLVEHEEPPHTALPIRANLDNHFPRRWIGRYGQTE